MIINYAVNKPTMFTEFSVSCTYVCSQWLAHGMPIWQVIQSMMKGDWTILNVQLVGQ